MKNDKDWEWDYPPVTGSPVVDDPPLVMGGEKATGAALWCVYVVLAAVVVVFWVGVLRMVGVVG